MRDIWYADNRDLVKWAVLFILAKKFKAEMIFQIAYYSQSDFGKIRINGKAMEIPNEVISHFRNILNIKNIGSPIKVRVFKEIFKKEGRKEYHNKAMKQYPKQRCIVFLDPDIGLERKVNANLGHVLKEEAKIIWDKTKLGDVFVLYQHHTHRSRWIERKRLQLERVLGAPRGSVKIAKGIKIARDVVFFYIQRVK